MRKVQECKEIIESAIGKVVLWIPDDVLMDIMKYLDEYERLKSEKSWDEHPDMMGRW